MNNIFGCDLRHMVLDVLIRFVFREHRSYLVQNVAFIKPVVGDVNKRDSRLFFAVEDAVKYRCSSSIFGQK